MGFLNITDYLKICFIGMYVFFSYRLSLFLFSHVGIIFTICE